MKLYTDKISGWHEGEQVFSVTVDTGSCLVELQQQYFDPQSWQTTSRQIQHALNTMHREQQDLEQQDLEQQELDE